MEPATELTHRLIAYIEGGEDDFGELALAVFRHQYRCNQPYRAFCDARGATPDRVGSWQQIPAVPTDAFKATELTCGDPARAAAVFRTSGTTGGTQRRGTHYVSDLAPYHAALRSGFARHLLPDRERIRIISLVPPLHELPDSSLAHMVHESVAAFGSTGSAWHVSADGGIALEPLLADLRELERSDEPVLLAGTSFTFVHLFDAMKGREESLQLPEGSRAMDTGGFKGRSREVARAELMRNFEAMLGLRSEWIVNEYGMTEMGSQFYDGIAGHAAATERRYTTPRWVRTVAVDPETLGPVAPGETGILRHLDLANVNSVAMLQTADLGAVHAEGFLLFGRAPGAEPRGCSIAMDELLLAIAER
jgi:hypothetical protein